MQQTVWPAQANIDPPISPDPTTSGADGLRRPSWLGKLSLAGQNSAGRQQESSTWQRSTKLLAQLASRASVGATCCADSFVGHKQRSSDKLGPDCQSSDSDDPQQQQQQQLARHSSGSNKNIIIIIDDTNNDNKADNNDDSNNEGAFASSTNQFNTCSINDNDNDDDDDVADHESDELYELSDANSTKSDRHKHHRQISPSSSLFSSSASSLLSYIEPARSKWRRRRRASASSITCAPNNRLGDCSLDRYAGSSCSSSQQQRYSSTMIFGSDGSSPRPNCASAAAANNLLLLDGGERNQYYKQASLYNNTNKTALFSRATTKDAPPSSGGATSTPSIKCEQEVDNSGKPTTTSSTTESRNTTRATSATDSSDQLSNTNNTNITAAADGYVWPSLISASLSPSCSSSLRRSQSCDDTIIYNLTRRRRRLCYLQISSANLHANNNNLFNYRHTKQTKSNDNNFNATTTSETILNDLLSADQPSSISNQSDQPLNVIAGQNFNQNNNNEDHQQTEKLQISSKEAGKKSGPQRQINSGNVQSTSFGESMAILQQLSIQDRLEAPKTYPNNTLIVDLNKCHYNVANCWWPQTTTTAKKSAIKSSNLASFWSLLLGRKQGDLSDYERSDLQRPSKTAKKSRYKFPMPDTIARTNVKVS